MFRKQLLRSSRTASQAIKQTPRAQRISPSTFPSLNSSTIRLSQPTASQFISRRWQSSEAQKSEENANGNANGDKDAATTPSAEESLKQEVEKKNKEITDLKDKYLRSVADYRNLQDRAQRDQTSARNFAIQKFAADLLDSVDNLDRALGAVPETAIKPTDGSSANTDLVNLHSGIRMTEEIMMGVLKKHGLERFDPQEREGKKFDPNTDEATFFAKQEGKNDGEVFFTQQKGFTLNGRVIRAAKVGVVKNS